MLSLSKTKLGRQSMQVWLVRQAEQLAVVQASQGRVPSEVVPLRHWVQVLFSKPKPNSQLVQVSAVRLQVLQEEAQASQRKLVRLVNSLEAQATQALELSRPKPLAHWVQNPLVALHSWQLVHSKQTPVPFTLKVFAAQAVQVVLSGANPAAQVSQEPLMALQVKQLELQFVHTPVPSEKVPAMHSVQVPLSKPKPPLQAEQTPSVLLQALQLVLQASHETFPPGEKVPLTQISQVIPLICDPAAQSRQSPVVLLQVRQLESQLEQGALPLEKVLLAQAVQVRLSGANPALH